MTHWMCTNCGYYLHAPAPPNRCPQCGQTCAFNDVTCYRPVCGGERNLDPLLVGNTLRGLSAPASKPKNGSVANGLDGFPLVQIF